MKSFLFSLAIVALVALEGQITYELTQAPPYKEIEELFIESFSTTLTYPEGFLKATIDEEFFTPSDWILITDDTILVGCLIIDSSHYPEFLYIKQGFIKPSHFRKGLIKNIVPFIANQYPQCDTLYSITRKTNEVSISLHKSLGFTPSTYMHEGYDPEIYTGFEYTRKPLS